MNTIPSDANKISSQAATIKNTPPISLNKHIVRTETLEKIEKFNNFKLIYIHAPAGFGKSTLLQQYFDRVQPSRKCVWINLDHSDNDLDTFIQNLSFAWFGTYNIRSKNALIDEIIHSSNQFSIFLDEFEHIQDPAILNLIQQLIEYLPNNGEIFIASRQQLPLRVASLCINGQAIELNQTDLALKNEHIFELIYENYGYELNPIELRLLKEKTEGWIIAIHLFGLTLNQKISVSESIQKFSSKHYKLTQFLTEEILSHLNLAEKNFLLSCCVFNHLNASACDWLLNRNDSHQVLKNLEEKNIFLIQLDSNHECYRFHTLFLGYLRNQLKNHNPLLFQQLQTRAADWYVLNNDPFEAIEHFLLAEYFDKAIQLLIEHSQSLLEQGRVRFLLRSLEQIPKDIFQKIYPLRLVYSLALILNHRFEDAKIVIDQMAIPKQMADQEIQILDCLWLAMTDQIELSYRACAAVYREDKSYQSLLDNFFISIYSHYLIACNEIHYARNLMNLVLNHRHYVPNTFVHTIHEYNESCIDLIQGRLEQAYIRLYTNYHCTWRDSQNSIPGGKAMIGTLLAEVLYEKNELEDSFNIVKNCLPYARQNGHIDALISSYVLTSKLEFYLHHNQTAALCVLKELEYIGADYQFERVRATSLLEQARIHYINQDYYLSRKILFSIQHLGIWSTLEKFNMPAQNAETAQMMLWRLDIQNGDGEQHEQSLKIAIQRSTSLKYKRLNLKLRMILATLYYSLDEIKKSVQIFLSVLMEASTEKFVRTIMDEGPIAHQLIHLIHQNTNEHSTLNQTALNLLTTLYQQIDLSYIDKQLTVKKKKNIINLSKREVEILNHAAEGLKNREIAEKIFLAETTVKAHLRRIHVKLDAHSRTEAIAIARRNGMLI